MFFNSLPALQGATLAIPNDLATLVLHHLVPTSIVVLGLVTWALYRYLGSPWRKLPPGPLGYPIIGSAFKFFDSGWLIRECPKHGDMVYLNVAGQPVIVLNSQKVATDILDRRAATNSGRPRLIVASELMCDDMLLGLEPYSDRWRRQRRAVHEGFSRSAVKRFHPALVEDAIRLALSLSHDPSEFRKHYQHYACSTVLAVTYDRPLHGKPEDDSLRVQIDAIVRKLVAAASPGAHLVEIMPWMLWLPEWMAKWKRDALEAHRVARTFFLGLIEQVHARDKQGEARPCLTTTLVQDLEHFQLSKLEAAWAAGMMYAGGAETTTVTLTWWTLAMVAFPAAQKRAQAELDAVVGRGRLPSFADREHLPYTVAVLREVLRWRMSLPLALPHTSDEDDWYEGMFIPKGTILLANLISCNRDPAVYGEDAHVFKPERHLDEQDQLKPAPTATKNHGHVSFGFGRRNCVGQHVADDTLFIATAVLLWAFDFAKARDEKGQELSVDIEGYDASGFTLRANHFECSVTPRYPEVTAVLVSEKENL
ncbi:cytochrome P450 [Peniophora sp. CONT]|nr:cytochrome P450 [Peniophora sp. CONT]